MKKKTILDLKKSQIVIINGDDCDICIEKGVLYYPMSSVAMVMEHGAADEKFRIDGILCGLWCDTELTEQDLIDMKCRFAYEGAEDFGKESDGRLFSVLFFDGNFLDLKLKRNEFDFIISMVRDHLVKIKSKEQEFSPLSGNLPMVRSMDDSEINMVADWRKRRMKKACSLALIIEVFFSLFAVAGIFLLSGLFFNTEQKCFSVFIVVLFLSIFIASSTETVNPMRDVEAEGIGDKK